MPGRLYSKKLPLTAVQLLNNDVLPASKARRAKIDAVLSDNSASSAAARSCFRSSKTSSTSEPGSTGTIYGIVERWNRTLLDEHFRVEGRRTWFETLEEMQTVLDQYLVEYNTKRPHQGRGMNGRTPIAAFIDGIRRENTPQSNPIQKAA